MTTSGPDETPAPAPAPAPATAAEMPGHGLVPDHVRRLAWLLDDAIPFVAGRRIGLDGFMSFVPVVGDATGFGLSAVVVLAGVRAGCSWPTVARMVLHAGGESLLGLIPLLGPLVAFVWKANQRNLRIIEKDLRDRDATRRESWKVLSVAAGLVVVTLLLVALAAALFVISVWNWLAS